MTVATRLNMSKLKIHFFTFLHLHFYAHYFRSNTHWPRARDCVVLRKPCRAADNVFVDNTRPVSPIERNHRSKRVSVGEKRYSFRTPFYELLPTFFFVTFLGHGQTTREAKKNFICTPKKVDFGSINVQEGPIAFRAIHMGVHSLLNERGYSA